MTVTVHSYAWRCGARPPLSWERAHEEVLATRDALWNDLRAVWMHAQHLEAELIRSAGGESVAQAQDAVVEGEREIATLLHERRQVRRSARRRADTPELDTALDRAFATQRTRRKAMWEAERETRRRPGVRERLRDIRRERRQACNQIACGKERRYSLLRDGDYNDVRALFERTVRPRKGRWHEPKEKRKGEWRQRSSYYVQLQGGVTWEWLRDESARRTKITVSISPHPRGDRRWHLLRAPIDTQGTTLEIPFCLDREMPATARIKGVRITRRQRAGTGGHVVDWHVVWSLSARELPGKISRRGKRTMAVGLGWRQTPNGLRVAGALHESGTVFHVVLPAHEVTRWADSAALQASLRRAANAMRERVGKWLLEHRPSWLAQEVRDLAWAATETTRTAPLLTVARAWPRGRPLDRELHGWAWGDARGSADTRDALREAQRTESEETYADAVADALGEIRGTERVHAIRAKLVRRRQHLYRMAARRLVESCERIVLGGLDTAQCIRVEGSDLSVHSRHLAAIAAPYALSQEIRWQATKSGMEVVEAEPADATRYCAVHPECDLYAGLREPGKQLYLRCAECGTLDRDENYAANLLRRTAPECFERWEEAHGSDDRSQARIRNLIAEYEREVQDEQGAMRRLRSKYQLALARRERS